MNTPPVADRIGQHVTSDETCAVERKCWGDTRRIGLGSSWDVHYLNLIAGGYCSRHRHLHKANLFYVATGRIAVEFFNPDESVPYKTVEVGPEQTLSVPALVWHRFRVLESGIAVEIYWPGSWNPDDIDRAEQGGMNPNEKWIDAGE